MIHHAELLFLLLSIYKYEYRTAARNLRVVILINSPPEKNQGAKQQMN
jgi:hypothetical protein